MLMNGKNPNKNIMPLESVQSPYDPMKVIPVGNLSTKRIVIDVRDCVRAYKELMDNFDDSINGQAYNVCGPKEEVSPMQKFTDILIEESGLEGIVQVKDSRVYRPIDIEVQVGDTEKLREKTGWKPEIPLRETLTNLFNYWVKKTA